MGETFENLTWDDLCDLMCGCPEDDEEDFDSDDDIYNVGWERESTSKINARNIRGEFSDSAGQTDKTDNISISRVDV